MVSTAHVLDLIPGVTKRQIARRVAAHGYFAESTIRAVLACKYMTVYDADTILVAHDMWLADLPVVATRRTGHTVTVKHDHGTVIYCARTGEPLDGVFAPDDEPGAYV